MSDDGGMPPPPQPLPDLPGIPEPRDEAYPGLLTVAVDVTDVERRIFRVRQTIPLPPVAGDAAADPREILLLYPKWLPGFHAPQAPIELFAGLVVRANGEELVWKRHPVTVNAFHVDVPGGAQALDVEFQFLSPTEASQGRVTCTPDMVFMPWNAVLLYPAGHFARRITVAANVTLPAGWRLSCALDLAEQDGDRWSFAPAPLDVVVDSPVLAGRHLRRIALDEDVHLTLVADQPHQLEATPEQIAPHRGVVEQADRLFGARHFDRFEMLLAMSDEMTSAGVEHHQSFQAVTTGDYFTDWDASFVRRDTIAHEYVHSWNGKYRRGADSWSPCFEKPIRNSLMWVYEGLTQYWTHVLSARSGLWTADQALGAIAQTAARYDVRPGSRWRPTIDTTRDPIIAERNPLPWTSWQRSEDYYGEGGLIWLDVDTRIRELTGEARSLDDFARGFFGAGDPRLQTWTYEFDDVIDALDRVVGYDWAAFFREKLNRTHGGAPLDGIARGGYRIAYRDEPSGYQTGNEHAFGQIDYTHSLGLTLSPQGKLTDVLWEGTAFEAGLTLGMTITGVGDRVFDPDTLRRAVRAGRGGEPVRLTLTRGKALRVVEIACPEGPRFPHLERVEGAPARLDAILRAREE
jgi:predicted metalloprotease with PDZ domain